MLVAQWDKVHPHPHGSDDHEGIDQEYLEKVDSNSLLEANGHILTRHNRNVTLKNNQVCQVLRTLYSQILYCIYYRDILAQEWVITCPVYY